MSDPVTMPELEAGSLARGDTPETGADLGSAVTIDGREFPIRPHHCFACGDLNLDGLRLRLHIEGDGCWTEVELSDRFEGWQGIAHGGIVCTILDEVMAWSLARTDSWGVTARLSVDFKRPVPVGIPIRAEGRLAGSRRRLRATAATLVDARDGTILATATAIYVAAPPEERRALKARYGFPDLDGVIG
jgi:acyl-coenzyme A thioesterase PaaI-like protein